MTTAGDLPLPRAPERVDPVGAPSDTLVHAGPAGPRTFLLASPSVAVHGTEREGVDGVESAEGEILRSLRTGGGPCSNVLVGPRALRRELAGPGGTILETVLAADRHPAVLAQWTTPSHGGLALDARWDVPGPTAAHRAAGALLRVRPERGPDRLFAVLPPPERWELEAGSGGLAVRVRVRADAGAVSLMAAAVEQRDDGGTALRALADTPVLERRVESFLTGVRDDLLATRTGVAGIDDGLAWAVARTAGGPAFLAPPADPIGRLWMLAGTLAAGAWTEARPALEVAPADAAGALALGWWVRWTGETGLFLRHRDAALDALFGGTDGGPVPIPPPAVRAARSAVADALEAVGDRDAAARVRAGPRGAGGGRAEPVSLPLAGGSSGAPADAVLGAILGDVDAPVPDVPDPGSHATPGALRSWALYAKNQPDEAYPLLRDHLGRGIRDSAGVWAPPPGRAIRGRYDPVAAALVPALVLNGLLGARAEAPWGRIRLAPAFPAGWSRFEVGGIRVGDARIRLRYARAGADRTFTLRQTTGRIPFTVVFEPSVAGRVSTVRVDGTPADVPAEPLTGRTRVRLQLPLDAVRSVTLGGSEG